jgi:hypothetical protein
MAPTRTTNSSQPRFVPGYRVQQYQPKPLHPSVMRIVKTEAQMKVVFDYILSELPDLPSNAYDAGQPLSEMEGGESGEKLRPPTGKFSTIIMPRHGLFWVCPSLYFDIMSSNVPHTPDALRAVSMAAFDPNRRSVPDILMYKRVRDEIECIHHTDRTPDQHMFLVNRGNKSHWPDWFQSIFDRQVENYNAWIRERQPSADNASVTPTASRRRSAPIKLDAPKITTPAFDACVEEWVEFFVKKPEFCPNGISRDANGRPNLDQLCGYLYLRRLVYHPVTKAENRHVRISDQYTELVPIFTVPCSDSTSYSAVLERINITPDSGEFTPKPFSAPKNLGDDFIRHAASCGLSLEMAKGPVRAFLVNWVND